MNEREAINAMWDAHRRLLALGWNDATYAPKDTPLQVIEAGSTGIHEATRDELGFWIDGDAPSYPVLFRLAKASVEKSSTAEAP